MGNCDLFEEIAEKTWDLICSNHEWGNRLVEEGITRMIVIDHIQGYVKKYKKFKIFAQKSPDEVNRGGDLEIYWDNGNQKFSRILLQAKLVEPEGYFKDLNRESGSKNRKQYDTLNSFANSINSDAFYLMYNGCPGYTCTNNDCAGQHNEKQYGCAILDVHTIKKHCENNSTGTLGSSKNPVPHGEPWRKMSCCGYKHKAENKLYSFDEIDMDHRFKNLFRPQFGFITTEMLVNEEKIVEENDLLHRRGWNPLARIIISEEYMTLDSDGFLDLY